MTHALYDNRHWVIISAADVSNIDFSQVYETSVDTLRYSIDESQTFVKYDGSQLLALVKVKSMTTMKYWPYYTHLLGRIQNKWV